MKRKLFLTLAGAGLLGCAGSLFAIAANNHPHETNAFTPDTIPWGPAPPVVRPGAQFAVLEGDPTASSGDYTIRLKMPDGFSIAPHWQTLRGNVKIISRTFRGRVGDEVNKNKMK